MYEIYFDYYTGSSDTHSHSFHGYILPHHYILTNNVDNFGH